MIYSPRKRAVFPIQTGSFTQVSSYVLMHEFRRIRLKFIPKRNFSSKIKSQFRNGMQIPSLTVSHTCPCINGSRHDCRPASDNTDTENNHEHIQFQKEIRQFSIRFPHEFPCMLFPKNLYVPCSRICSFIFSHAVNPG